MKSDICVIGAGPAGLVAASTAARFLERSGGEVLVVEKNSTAARKLLKTGRGRCNITHSGSIEDFVRAYGRYGRFLRHSLYEFSPKDVLEFFRQKGLETKTEATGCVFPVTDRASDVKDALLEDAVQTGVRFMYGSGVTGVDKEGDGFVLRTAKEAIYCKAVIVATGGVSWPGTGSTGDGYRLGRKLGHRIADPKAALVPLVTNEEWPGLMQGLAVGDVQIRAKINGKSVKSSGPMMFTGDGIGGPAVFDMSRQLADVLADSKEPVVLSIDLLPDVQRERLEERITSQCQTSAKKKMPGVISGLVAQKLAGQLCRMADCYDTYAASLTKAKRRKLVESIKAMELSIKSARPIAEATVTRGGVDTAQIDGKTMESKICPGLFFCGEVMDVDGPCGGYNLQIAWSTGFLAGMAAARASVLDYKGRKRKDIDGSG